MTKLIDVQLKNDIKEFIDTKLNFNNEDEKDQFMEFLSPIFNNQLNELDIGKLSKKEDKYFKEIIGKFQIDQKYYENPNVRKLFSGKPIFKLFWYKAFLKVLTYSLSISIILSLIIQKDFSLLEYLAIPSFVFSAIWGLKCVYTDTLFINKEDIRKEFYSQQDRKSFLAQFVFYLDQYKQPLSKKFIDTLKNSTKTSEGNFSDFDKRLAQNIKDDKIYALNANILTRKNCVNLKHVVNYAYGEYYEHNKRNIQNEEIAKRFI